MSSGAFASAAWGEWSAQADATELHERAVSVAGG